MRKILISSLTFAAAAIVVASPSIAADTKLVWNDLDLATEAGQAELDRRIETAAGQVCASEAITGSRIARRAASSCLSEARDTIKAQVAAKTAKSRSGNTFAEAR